MAVWFSLAGTKLKLDTIPLGGGAVHNVANLPQDVQPWAVGHGKAVVFYSSNQTIHVIDLTTENNNSFGAGTGSAFFGGAISPDGTKLVYVGGDVGAGELRIINLQSGVITKLLAFPASSNSWSIPSIWNQTAMAGSVVIPFSDAGSPSVFQMNPTNGSVTGSTTLSNGVSRAISQDALHGADVTHSALGDDADVTPAALGPQGPFNTLRLFSIGNNPNNALQEQHHNISALAMSNDGSVVCYGDDSAIGGFAGISQANNFGLFLYMNGASVQLAHYDGSAWDGGAFVANNQVVVGHHVGKDESLELYKSGAAAVHLDTVTGGTYAYVYVA
jgi:hypothetical protein